MHYTPEYPATRVHITHPGGRTCGGIYATEVIIHAYYKYFILLYMIIIIISLGNEDMHRLVRVVKIIIRGLRRAADRVRRTDETKSSISMQTTDQTPPQRTNLNRLYSIVLYNI